MTTLPVDEAPVEHGDASRDEFEKGGAASAAAETLDAREGASSRRRRGRWKAIREIFGTSQRAWSRENATGQEVPAAPNETAQKDLPILSVVTPSTSDIGSENVKDEMTESLDASKHTARLTEAELLECPVCCNEYTPCGAVPVILTCCETSVCLACAEKHRASKVAELTGTRKRIHCMMCNVPYHSEKDKHYVRNKVHAYYAYLALLEKGLQARHDGGTSSICHEDTTNGDVQSIVLQKGSDISTDDPEPGKAQERPTAEINAQITDGLQAISGGINDGSRLELDGCVSALDAGKKATDHNDTILGGYKISARQECEDGMNMLGAENEKDNSGDGELKDLSCDVSDRFIVSGKRKRVKRVKCDLGAEHFQAKKKTKNYAPLMSLPTLNKSDPIDGFVEYTDGICYPVRIVDRFKNRDKDKVNIVYNGYGRAVHNISKTKLLTVTDERIRDYERAFEVRKADAIRRKTEAERRAKERKVNKFRNSNAVKKACRAMEPTCSLNKLRASNGIKPEIGMEVSVWFPQDQWYTGKITKVKSDAGPKTADGKEAKEASGDERYKIGIDYDDGTAESDTAFPDPDILVLLPDSEGPGPNTGATNVRETKDSEANVRREDKARTVGNSASKSDLPIDGVEGWKAVSFILDGETSTPDLPTDVGESRRGRYIHFEANDDLLQLPSAPTRHHLPVPHRQLHPPPYTLHPYYPYQHHHRHSHQYPQLPLYAPPPPPYAQLPHLPQKHLPLVQKQPQYSKPPPPPQWNDLQKEFAGQKSNLI